MGLRCMEFIQSIYAAAGAGQHLRLPIIKRGIAALLLISKKKCNGMGTNKKPRPGPGRGFVLQAEAELHGCYEVGNDEGRILLQQLGHARCHAGIHLGGAEGIDADAFAGLRETVLRQGHENA